MEATRILRNDYYWVWHVHACLVRLVNHAREQAQLDLEASLEVVSLLESFANDGYRLKEEHALFPELLKRATPAQEDNLRRLLGMHMRGRELLERMRTSLFCATRGQKICASEFVGLARAFLDLNREHMTAELGELFPMAERTLGPREDAAILDGFRRLEAAGSDTNGVPERVSALCRRLGVPVVTEYAA